MKVKISLIPFIPVAIAMVGLKIMSIFGLDSNGMFLGMDKITINYLVIGLALGLFVVCVLINLFDRKTAPVYPVKKNPMAGIFAILSGFAVIGSSVMTLLNTTPESEYYIVTLISAAFSIPAGIAFMFMSKVHFTGKSIVSGISMLFIFPALWGCAELVSEFLVATKVSISASDMTALFCYIFLTLYFFSHSMIVSRIKGRNPVKACFIYGLPAVAISLAFGAHTICTIMIEGMDIAKLLFGAEQIILALYAVSFIVEMALNSYTKDEIEIIDGLPDDEDSYENSYVKSGGYDDLVFAEKEVSTENEDNEATVSVEDLEIPPTFAGLDDFVLGYNNETEPKPYIAKDDDSSRLVFLDNDERADVKAEESKPDVSFDEVNEEIKKEETPVVKSPVEQKPVKFEPETEEIEKKLSDIDLLLQELDNKK